MKKNNRGNNRRKKKLKNIGNVKVSIKILTPDGVMKDRRRNILKFPENLSFNRSHCEETLKAISKISKELYKEFLLKKYNTNTKTSRSGKYFWSFENIENISPSVSLVIAAEYQRWSELCKISYSFVDVPKWNPNVLFLLNEIGFLKNFGLNLDLGNIPENSILKILPLRSGVENDPQSVALLIQDLKEELSSLSEDIDEDLMYLYGAMVEGITNVVRHAYPEGVKTKYPNVNKWWMTGAVSKKLRKFFIIIYDQGITIPKSLPKWDKYDRWKENMDEYIRRYHSFNGDISLDCATITEAVKTSVSSTSEGHRGLGLAQMHDIVQRKPDSWLRITSRNGDVIFRGNNTRDSHEKKILMLPHKHPINGTLIEWLITF